MSKEFRTSIGGQALMEGIMMRGPEKICCAVRKPDGTIDLTYDTVTVHWYNRVPLVRGICNMAENLYKGYRYLMHAADIAMEGETEPAESKLDKWFEEHATPAVQNVLMTCAAFVGVVLALFLFTFLPTFLTGLVMKVVPLGRWPRVILEGALKMAIFLGYMFLCTRFKDLHRVFEYHGAEHKTIACYEAGLPLTVENIRRQSRFHPRCGTSFMILVIIISIFLYAVLPWTSTGMRIVYKLCMFPLLVGISYEILKWAGRSDSVLSKIVSQPGLWMPRVILEGALKMAIFLGYMFLCTRFKDLHRVFEYHGAEHKTIACYEAGLPLTVENIRRQSRFHPRCGTSFMILVIIISIFLYAVLPWTSTGMRIVYKLCMFPLLVGISYEILKWAGRSDSVLSKIVSQPGLWMQRLTTFEPDDSMIEVAIAAVTPVLPEKQEEARW